MEQFPGDLLIALSDADFISFTSRVGDRVLVGIKSDRLAPLTLPNVVRNVAARLFPLTDKDLARLRRLYPPDWTARGPHA